MTSARSAGFAYLFLIATGIFALAYAPTHFNVWGDAAKTLELLIDDFEIFKLAIVAELLCYASFVVLGVFLYKALQAWSSTWALLLLGFVLVSVPIGFMAVTEKLAIVELINSGRATAQNVSEHFEAYNRGIEVVEVFWGLWLLPYGILVLMSGAIPRLFGVALIWGCIHYTGGVFVPMFFDEFLPGRLGEGARLFRAFGEIGSAIWLSVMGARPIDRQISP